MRPIRPGFNNTVLPLVIMIGCASTNSLEKETSQEAMNALGAVAGTISKQEMDAAKMEEVAGKIRTDEEAQTAVQAISESLEGKSVNIKYSPVTGKRYSGELQYDPETGAKLLPLEP